MLTWIEKRQLTKLATWYYIDGWTHEEIAGKLGISRPVVSKQLQRARDIGIIDFYIENETRNTIKLESDLKRKFSLTYVKVVPSNHTLVLEKAAIMKVTVLYLLQRFSTIASLGIGWGNTMSSLVEEFPYHPFAHLKIIPLIGGIGASSKNIHSNDLALLLAKKLMCDYAYLYSPFIATSHEMKESLLQIPEIHQTLMQAKNVDLAIVGLGIANQSATLSKIGYLSETDVRELAQSNVIGDITSYFFNQSGQEINSEFSAKTIGIGLKNLKSIPEVLGISYDREKIPSAYVSLKYKYLNSFITNESTANSLLQNYY
ncbi:sugar-binding transcriptional regulator [Pectinatus haikarae]|uniref:DNA-binding transcriptional regulator LsrR (DeoR family) n=1 Tax=Pectinatus haikarae TaxID=349096 RepID=A0ABT9Y6V9_9FIRM|nr:sugar-binding domain-containing protein [Pectinatus haikarae]MDQ0202889.1 DNA-binding transcriptional regulator LsrR (DeoR family) [Pectinatus haikarae]